MPNSPLPDLHPALLQQAREAGAAIELAQARPAPQYTVIYPAFFGCGEKVHNFDNLKRADALSNVRVRYINVDAGGWHSPLKDTPGQVLRFSDQNARDHMMNDLLKLYVFDGRAVLLDPQNHPIGRFSTKDPHFVEKIQQATKPHTPPARTRA